MLVPRNDVTSVRSLDDVAVGDHVWAVNGTEWEACVVVEVTLPTPSEDYPSIRVRYTNPFRAYEFRRFARKGRNITFSAGDSILFF